MKEVIRVGLIQMRCQPDPEVNLAAAIEKIRAAAADGARLVVLQELFRSQYFCQIEDAANFDLAEPIPGPTTEILGREAAEQRIVLVASIFEKRTAGIYHNSLVVLDAEGQIAGRYRKMHIPDDPLYYEKFYFTPGDLGFRTVPTQAGDLGLLICWDQWFPEAARLTALEGAQFLLYPTAIGWLEGEQKAVNQAQRNAWLTVQRGHAVANGVFVASVNRVGCEGKLNFWGSSFVCDPFGQLLAQASSSAEEVLLVDCDLGLIEETRRHWPFLRDRRIDSYQGLSARFLDGSKG